VRDGDLYRACKILDELTVVDGAGAAIVTIERRLHDLRRSFVTRFVFDHGNVVEDGNVRPRTTQIGSGRRA
jgi:hypothetical protein